MTQAEMKDLLAEAWKEVFQVDTVEDDADFFEAGGDSIMAVQLAAWLIQKGVKLDLVDIFTASTFGAMAEKLTEGKPMYVPAEMMTKEIAAKEMGFSSVEEAQAAEKSGFGAPAMKGFNPMMMNPMMQMWNKKASKPAGEQKAEGTEGNQTTEGPAGNQQACTPNGNPMGNQQVCTPNGNPMGNQQVCTPNGNPMGNQQVCNPMGNQQMCNPMGNQQVCNPMGNQQVCNPMGKQQVCTPNGNPMGNQQVCTPNGNPMGNQQVCTPNGNPMGNQQMCTPANGENPAGGMDPKAMIPPQIRKYMSVPVEEPIEKPNVIKINKVELGEKVKSPEEALTEVLKGLLPNFNPEADLFEQGLTSLDTVKMVTRCAEAGYQLDMKDIYTHSTFDELFKCMK